MVTLVCDITDGLFSGGGSQVVDTLVCEITDGFFSGGGSQVVDTLVCDITDCLVEKEAK